MQDLRRTLLGVPSCTSEHCCAGQVWVAVLSSMNKFRRILIGICAPRDVCVSTPLICVSAIASPTHLCQGHCISCSFVSVPLHLPLICISAIASPTHMCQCHCISHSFVSVPLPIPLTGFRAIASPTHSYQWHYISCSVVSCPLHLLLS